MRSHTWPRAGDPANCPGQCGETEADVKRFFNQNNVFFRFMGILFDLIELNLITLIFCIPVFTAGAAFVAMHYVLWHMVRGEDSYIAMQFWQSFKDNWKNATVIWFLVMIVGLIMWVDLRAMGELSRSGRSLLEVILIVVALLTVSVAEYAFFLLSRYENTAIQTLTNAGRLALGFLPRTLAMTVITIGAAVLYAAYLVYLLPLVLLLGFTLPQYCCAWLYNPIFKRLEEGGKAD